MKSNVDCRVERVILSDGELSLGLGHGPFPSSFRHASGLIGEGIDLSDAKLSISEVDDGMHKSDV